jgi:hypothetical protein
MASMTFDLQWKEAMVELLDQLQEMDPEAEGSEAFAKLAEASDAEKFQMYATLYVRYLQIFRALEESYDMTVHPQKRMDVKKTLEAVMGRLLEVKETLILLKKGVNFINLDDVLVDLKLTPDVLEVPVPKFFIEDQQQLLEEREKYLDVRAPAASASSAAPAPPQRQTVGQRRSSTGLSTTPHRSAPPPLCSSRRARSPCVAACTHTAQHLRSHTAPHLRSHTPLAHGSAPPLTCGVLPLCSHTAPHLRSHVWRSAPLLCPAAVQTSQV